MKKLIVIVCILSLLLTVSATACTKTDERAKNLSCSEMLDNVLNAKVLPLNATAIPFS